MSGEVPEGWEVKSLAEVAKINIGGTPSRSNDAYWAKDSDGFTWVSIADLKSATVTRSKERITSSGISNSNVKLVRAGTVLMSFKLTVGRVAVAGVDLYTNEAIAAFNEDKTVLDSRFLAQFLPIFVNRIETEQAVKGRTLNKQSLSQIPITLPPLPEQQRIAKILSSVDESIRATEAVIAQAERVKRGLMEDLLTGGLGSAAIANGEVPEGWKIGCFGDLANIKNGFAFKSNDFTDETDDTVLVLRMSNFNDGDVSYEDCKRVKVAVVAGLDRFSLSHGDIVIAMSGATVGKLGRVRHPQQKVYLNQRVGCVVSKDMRSANFLWQVMGSDAFRVQIIQGATGNAQPNISGSQIENVVMAVPPLEKQIEIAEALSSVDDQIATNRATVDQLQRLKRGLMDDLLTGKVRAVS